MRNNNQLVSNIDSKYQLNNCFCTADESAASPKQCSAAPLSGKSDKASPSSLTNEDENAATTSLNVVSKEEPGSGSASAVADAGSKSADVEGGKTVEEIKDMEFNSLAFTQCFYSNETSFSLFVGGVDQNYARKRFDHGSHICFLDLEALSNLPKLFNYFILSAVALEREKKVFYCTCYIEHKATKRRYLLLAILRSKCLAVRYDYVVCDEEDNNCVSLLVGITKMNPYNFLPDVEVDLAAAREILRSYLCDPANKLALIEGQVNKDEYGHLVGSDDMDPLQLGLDGGSSAKRSRKKISRYGEVESVKKQGRKRGLRNKTPGSKKGKKVIPTFNKYMCLML